MADPVDRLNAALEGRYRIERELGAGGMATVYEAEDLKHHRQVALKVLKPEVAALVGAERFLSEIEVTAHLQHPHVLPLFDSGEADGFLFYVMPYVKGESLRARLEREHQLPVDEAVRIAASVANALDYAHRHGVVHRDIKPANILLEDGEPVVADFGIALAVGAAGPDRLTETGLSLGTPHYMSPEQATGDQTVGPATDTFAIGCVLYEMLVGVPPYTGSTAQAILGKIVAGRPESIAAQRPSVPANVEAVIRKALERVPADRFASTQDFAKGLGDVNFRYGLGAVPGPAAGGFWKAVALGMGVVAVVVLLKGPLGRPAETPTPLLRFDVDFPEGYEMVRGAPPVTVSPDGSIIVYSLKSEGVKYLFKRHLDEHEAVRVEGSEGAHTPFFSPDGQWIGFVGDRTIEKFGVSGGAPILVGDAPFVSLGATWAPNTIVFAGVGSGLFRLPDTGGTAEPLTQLDAVQREVSHGWPSVLPDGRHILFTVGTGGLSRTAVVSLDTQERRWIEGIDGGSGARYVPSGHLVFAASDELFAVAFDVDRLAVTSSPISVQTQIYGSRAGTFARFSHFSVSPTGTMVFVPAGDADDENVLTWVGDDGSSTALTTFRGSHFYPRISPSGQYIAVQESNEIWIYDSERGTRNRLTSGGGTDPVWTPDGERITFSAPAAGRMSLHWMPFDGSEAPELLLTGENPVFPHSWTPDGSTLAFYEVSPSQARDVWMLVKREGGWKAEPFLATVYNERSPAFSPDGRWVAYVSDESGRDEVYVTPYPGPGGKVPVSRAGGREPVWARDGSELYYRQRGQVVAVAVEAEGAFSPGEPISLFSGGSEIYLSVSGSQTYDVAPGNRRFVMVEPMDVRPPGQIRVVFNWFEQLTQLVPN